MFSEKFIERVNRLIENQLIERRKQVPVEISKLQSEYSARGILHSSMTIFKIQEICEEEIEKRADIAWRCLVRTHEVLGSESSDDIATDLKQFMRENINSNYAELTQILSQNLMNMIPIEQVSMKEASKHIIDKHEIEIDFYLDALEKHPEKMKASAGQASTYHFYGNVGAVQTGPSALANIVQNLSSEDQESIKQALSLAREAITATSEIEETQKKELVEIVDDAQKELDSEKPNNTKLKSLFTTVAETIQTIASAQPAYQALKLALIPFGIILP